eukprot:TRINITY_DN20624_c0_g1_i1.p1 TRINITY_DN20624_c0_g1~~TRINITY_DN20624_c0_g1_i1.p1  ORF type:complete len:161 (-),score=40.93 TRINITY_DN20624_c0_g1_i1:182-631(-)
MYRPELWMWHAVTIARMLSLSFVATFFEDTAYFSGAVNTVLLITLIIQERYRPYKDRYINEITTMSMVVLFLGHNVFSAGAAEGSIAYAILLWSVYALNVIMFALFALILALPTLRLLRMIVASFRKKRGSTRGKKVHEVEAEWADDPQ